MSTSYGSHIFKRTLPQSTNTVTFIHTPFSSAYTLLGGMSFYTCVLFRPQTLKQLNYVRQRSPYPGYPNVRDPYLKNALIFALRCKLLYNIERINPLALSIQRCPEQK